MRKEMTCIALALITAWAGCGDRATSDRDGGTTPPPGSERGVCRSDGTCDGDLTCASGRCVRLPDAGAPDAPLCGNGTIDGTEQCDGSELRGQDCASHGYSGGTLRCFGNCTYNTSGCSRCGDGRASGAEVCDGKDTRGRNCYQEGFRGGGQLRCHSDCKRLDTSGCLRLPDGKPPWPLDGKPPWPLDGAVPLDKGAPRDARTDGLVADTGGGTLDSGGDISIGPIAGFGDTCNQSTPCPSGLTCLSSPGATNGFCSMACANQGQQCSGAPAGTFTACIATFSTGGGTKTFCAFLCKLQGQTFSCPSTSTCATTDNPPGSGQFGCNPPQ